MVLAVKKYVSFSKTFNKINLGIGIALLAVAAVITLYLQKNNLNSAR